jgi:hypothetical protein
LLREVAGPTAKRFGLFPPARNIEIARVLTVSRRYAYASFVDPSLSWRRR